MSLINKGPSIRTFATDNDLIAYINQISGGSYVTVADALGWVSGQDNVYVQNREFGEFLTEDLILYLDAGTVASYPKGGTTWYDLSQSSSNGTLVNGPTYSTSGGGSISYDSNGDYVTCPDVPINITAGEGNTIEQWIYWNGGDGEMTVSFGGVQLDAFINAGNIGFNNGDGLLYGTSFTEYEDVWSHVVFFFPSEWNTDTYENAKLWINGIKQDITISNGSVDQITLSTPSDMIIGGGFNVDPSQYSFGGNIALTRIYSRELTDSEVYTNYLADVNRFYNWILASGNWNDEGIWIDNETW